jgi:hypothetical protein
MEIRLTRRFLAAAAELNARDRAAVDAALTQLLQVFGRPHAHSGGSVRPLDPPVYELRASRALRIIFVKRAATLTMDFVGDHDAVREYLKNRR